MRTLEELLKELEHLDGGSVGPVRDFLQGVQDEARANAIEDCATAAYNAHDDDDVWSGMISGDELRALLPPR